MSFILFFLVLLKIEPVSGRHRDCPSLLLLAAFNANRWRSLVAFVSLICCCSRLYFGQNWSRPTVSLPFIADSRGIAIRIRTNSTLRWNFFCYLIFHMLPKEFLVFLKTNRKIRVQWLIIHEFKENTAKAESIHRARVLCFVAHTTPWQFGSFVKFSLWA